MGPEAATERTLELRLLGELSIHRDGDEVRLPPSKKTRALLAYLVQTGRPQRRARLCSLLWDVADDPRGALRWSLSKLRPLVDDAQTRRIVTEGDTVAFEPHGAAIDLVEARELLARGVDEIETETLHRLAGMFRGELLEGLDMSDFDDFQAWCIAARREARSLRAEVLRALVERLEPVDALPHARALVELDPVDEQVRASLVRLLAAAGHRDEARQQCEAGQRQLRELGAEPTGALHAALHELENGPAIVSAAPATVPIAAAEPVLVDDSPIIGRRAERARLSAVLARVTGDQVERIAFLSGEPGVGKTRLLVSLLDDIREAGGTILEGRAYEAERGRPFGPWIDALRPLADSAGVRLAPLFAPEMRPDRDQARTQLFGAVTGLLTETARTAPVVAIAIDDVQWIDEASAELLHYVARTLRGDRLLIALTARDGELVDNEPMQRVLRSLRRERLLDELDVGPLGRADTEALVRAVAPSADGAEVFEQCAGNPLFALELARSGRSGARELPPTLTEVVRERVERLSSESADVLHWAAVFGPLARIDHLAAVTALSADELMSALELLERHALLRADGDGYRLSHDLVRQVVYNELSEPRRRLMHRQIAQLLYAGGDADETTAADVAHHANLAGDAAMAARACVAAGRRSLKLFAKRDALALARRGARYAAELPEPDRTAVSIDLWDVRLAAEVPAERDQVCAELEELAERAIDGGQLEHARLGFHLLSYLRWDAGRNLDAFRHMLHAEQLTRGAEGPARIDALAEAARCLLKLDRDLGHAEALMLEARALSNRLGIDRSTYADAVGLLCSYQGKLDDAQARFREAQQLARREQDRLGEFQSLEHLVMLALRRDQVDEARLLTDRLLILGDKLREGSEAPTARVLAALTAHAAGDADARQRLDESLAQLRAIDAKQRLSYALLAAAKIDLARGDHTPARAAAEEALELVTLLRLRSDIAWAHAMLALAADARGDDADRDAHIDALRTSDVQGMAAYAREAAGSVLEIDR
jgi:predicted ATPase/DNA-binding SARP family transcriptional activator